MSIIKALKYQLPDYLLEIPHLEFPEQGVFYLTGANGSGKTSLIRCLLGLNSPVSGSWLFKQKDILKLDISKRDFGVVFQKDNLFPHLSVKKNIMFPSVCRNEDETKMKKDFDEISSYLNLENLLDKKASLLSGGERQKVALARSFMGSPQMIFLDEAFSSLDVSMRQKAWDFVHSRTEKLKIPCLVVSHDPKELENAKKVFEMLQGKLKT